MKRSLNQWFFPPLGLGAVAVLAIVWRLFFYDPVPNRSFDEIRNLVEGKNAAETLALLGDPDARQEVFGGDLRLIWWRYAVLDGPNHAPELRGRVVHVQIVFRNPATSPGQKPNAEWPMDEGLGVGYWLPGESFRSMN